MGIAQHLWRLVPPAIYLALAVTATWPLVRVADTSVLSSPSPEDILLTIWALRWDVHALATKPLGLFDANVMHPAPASLAFSEHFLGQVPTFAAFQQLTGNPLLAFNLNILLSFVLSGLCMHLLVARWTGSTVAAYAAGIAYAVAPWRLGLFHWPHLLQTQWLPAILYALDRIDGASHRLRWGALAGVLIALQMTCSFYIAYMTAVLIGCQLATGLVLHDRRTRMPWLAWCLALAIPLLVMVPLALPYLAHAGAGALSAPSGASDEHAATLLHAIGSPLQTLEARVGWASAILALLAGVPLLHAVRSGDRRTLRRILAPAATTIVALGITAGPLGIAGGWFAPYAWLAAVVPGFDLVRLPQRFCALASFGACTILGVGLAGCLPLLSRPVRVTAAGVALVATLTPLLGMSAQRIRPLPLTHRIPPVYPWLVRHGHGEPVLELPVTGEPPRPGSPLGEAEAMAMYYSTYHWFPLLNGYSGYSPPSYTALMPYAAALPEPPALRVLVACTGLRWIIVRAPDKKTELRWDAAPYLERRGAFMRRPLHPPKRRPRPGKRRRSVDVDLLYEVTARQTGDCPISLR